MKMPTLILAVLAAALLIAPAHAQDKVNPPRKEPIQKSAEKVRKLQKERIAILQELAVAVTKLYQNGRVDYNEVLGARQMLFKAELNAADKDSDRVALCKNMVDLWKQSEALAQQRMNAGQGTMVAVLKFKAMVLEAEILLEQVQVKKAAMGAQKIPERQKIVVASPQVKNVDITQQYVCKIHSHRHIKVRALQKGYLEQVLVKEGQAVKQGDVMFKITPVLYKAKWDAELAEVKLAELQLNNIQKLFEKNVVARGEVALYVAKLAKAQAKTRLAEAEFNFTMVRAPFDGIIDRLHEQQGSLVTERDILTTLSGNSLMWVYFNVSEARYLEYMARPVKDRDGKVELVLANGGKFKQSGKIGAIEAQFNSESANIPFRADFPNPDGLLRHGMTGNVLIHRTLNNAVVIPQRAAFEILDKWYVYVVDKDDVAHKRQVVIQNELDDAFVLSRGVGADDKIVFEGTKQVRDGEKVKYEFRPGQ